jgi:histidyl-tRNA synthetase
MSDEKLQEIKDSIDFQLQYAKLVNYNDTIIREEQELYNEVIRLRKLLKGENQNE